MISTVLMSYAAIQVEGHIRLEWILAEIDGDTMFSVLRASAPEWRFEGLEGQTTEAGGLSFSFTDETCRTGSSYRYRVDYHSTSGAPRTLFETRRIPVRAIPMALHQNYPNPFNPPTAIRFVVPGKEAVSLSVYDVAGKLVRMLVDSPLEAGPHEAIWDGRDKAGRAVSTGVYFSRLRIGDERLSRKMVLVR